eukprot:g2469.t1
MSDDDGDELCAYERRRLEHIKRNHEYLRMLGLVSDIEEIKQVDQEERDKKRAKAAAAKKARKEALTAVDFEPRRSSRVKGDAPQYTGERIDTFGEELCALADARRKRVTSQKRSETAKEREERRQEMLEESIRWLKESRAALLRVTAAGGHDGQAMGADEWREEAVRRWGPKVAQLQNVEDWEAYVASRMATPPPPSPLDLLQEYYAHDPWRLLTCCILMSRVSSWQTKHKCVSAFFARFPTPSALLVDEDDETGGSGGSGSSGQAIIDTLEEIMRPLGLFANRLKGVLSVAERFIEMPVFDVGLDKAVKIYGIGEFGVDSYKIFCRGLGRTFTPKDRTLNSFASWLKRQPAEDASGEGGGQDGESGDDDDNVEEEQEDEAEEEEEEEEDQDEGEDAEDAGKSRSRKKKKKKKASSRASTSPGGAAAAAAAGTKRKRRKN